VIRGQIGNGKRATEKGQRKKNGKGKLGYRKNWATGKMGSEK